MLPNGVRLDDARSQTEPNKSDHAAPKEPEKNLKKPEGLQRPISRKTLEIMLDRPSKKKFSEKLKDQSERLIFPFGRTRSAIDPAGEIEIDSSVHGFLRSNAADADRWCPA